MQATVQRTGVGDEAWLSGRLDGRSAGEVRDTLHAVLTAGSGRLVVDLSGSSCSTRPVSACSSARTGGPG